ncbi:alpha/beta fold hydrolase [Serratia microhaemolytica]|uniref:alpha/beta fold hydrolase n=1 Tax=Serratia microhaemolytica TaxID=2675110 RepID=UPI000FDEC56B|nr:alpha/beta hydrolase [Serratia microhaemolytica]
MNSIAQRQQADCGGFPLSWREAGQGHAVILLHGISSGSASWHKQLQDCALSQHYRLIAWDAPGYGSSAPLTSPQPTAADYAQALAALINQLQLERPIIVGHSLGALIGSAFAASYPQQLAGLILADPAQGYGSASAEKRQQVYQQRQQLIETLGPQGYAEQRATALLRPGAEAADIDWVRSGMANLNPQGFLAAAWMLANDDIYHYLQHCRTALQVWCGRQDSITPPEQAELLAQRVQVSLRLIEAAGHASYLDAAPQFNRYLQDFIRERLS